MNAKLLIGAALMFASVCLVQPASAYGACVFACVDVTNVDSHDITQVNAQTCVGNAVVQVGLSNTNSMCDQGGSGGQGGLSNLGGRFDDLFNETGRLFDGH